VKDRNPYSGYIIYFIFGIIFFLVARLVADYYADVPGSNMGAVYGIVVMYFGFGIAYIFTAKVWVSGGSGGKVYHRKKGCGGSSIQIRRTEAKSRGLEPCALCHKISGMNRN